MDKLEITKERVVEAAECCRDAKNVLKELFPEAFKCEEEWVDCTKECGVRFHPVPVMGGYDLEVYRTVDDSNIAYIWAGGKVVLETDGYRVRKSTTASVFTVERKEAPDDSP